MNKSDQILVVDDDMPFRRILVESLRDLKLDILEAETADAAIKLFHTHHPKMILTDIAMPGMNGLELVKILSGLDSNVLIAVMTGFSNEDMVIEAFKAGASDFLRKPFASLELHEIVSRFRGVIHHRRGRLFRPELLHKAELQLTIASSSRAIAPTVEYLSHLLNGFVTEAETMRLQLALDEAIRNAYEHGNLGISQDEKRNFLENDTLEKTLAERSAQARKEGKMIKIEVKFEEGKFHVSIEDEGPGFDWKIPMGETENPGSDKPHGRGLLLIKRIFDEVRFNKKGNRITMTKRLAELSPATSTPS